MAPRTLLIADGNEQFSKALAELLQEHFDVCLSHSGPDALEMLCTRRCKFLVLNLTLPELDGLTLLERAAQQDVHPVTLAITRLNNDYICEAAARLDVRYLMLRTSDIQSIASRMVDIAQSSSLQPVKLTPEAYAAQLIDSMKAPALKGYALAVTAIPILARDLEQSMTNEVYVDTAHACSCKSSSVERNIRNFLSSAWKHGDPAFWQRYFPGYTRYPVVSDFLTRMAIDLRQKIEAGEVLPL